MNDILRFNGTGKTIKILQVNYLYNMLEQDQSFIKRITAPMMNFKALHSAQATIAGIETAHIIRKGQIPPNGRTAFQQLAGLAAQTCPKLRPFKSAKTMRQNPQFQRKLSVKPAHF